MPLRPYAVLFGLAALLGACGDNDNTPGPGGVSVGEARALDEAAEMIEQQPSIPTDEGAQAAKAPPAQ